MPDEYNPPLQPQDSDLSDPNGVIASQRPIRTPGARRGARRGLRRSKTLAVRGLTKEKTEEAQLIFQAFEQFRPRSRGECRNAPRPCPWVSSLSECDSFSSSTRRLPSPTIRKRISGAFCTHKAAARRNTSCALHFSRRANIPTTKLPGKMPSSFLSAFFSASVILRGCGVPLYMTSIRSSGRCIATRDLRASSPTAMARVQVCRRSIPESAPVSPHVAERGVSPAQWRVITMAGTFAARAASRPVIDAWVCTTSGEILRKIRASTETERGAKERSPMPSASIISAPEAASIPMAAEPRGSTTENAKRSRSQKNSKLRRAMPAPPTFVSVRTWHTLIFLFSFSSFSLTVIIREGWFRRREAMRRFPTVREDARGGVSTGRIQSGGRNDLRRQRPPCRKALQRRSP